MKKVVMLSVILMCGCQTQPAATAYAPNCKISRADFHTPKEFSLKLWECGEKAEAKKVAKAEADNGSADMADIFLQILASDRETELGLAYALKYAEQGNEPASRWVLKIAEDQKIASLTQQVSTFYANIFNSAPQYPYLYLEEYILFSAQSLSTFDNNTDEYSERFFALSKDRLTIEEARRIQELLLVIKTKKKAWKGSQIQ